MGNVQYGACYGEKAIKRDKANKVQLSVGDSIIFNANKKTTPQRPDRQYNDNNYMDISPRRNQQNKCTIGEYLNCNTVMTPRGNISSECTTTSVQMCVYCLSSINEEMIFLSCQHLYHKRCFDQQIQRQLTKGDPLITCLCFQNISPNKFSNMLNEFQRNQLFKNQLNSIIQNEKIKEKIIKCSSKLCDFFYIRDQYYDRKNTICQLCI